MLKNITLSAEEELIARAREEAEQRGTTLNAEFRLWLAAFAEQERTARAYHELMEQLAHAHPGRRFSREELNARYGRLTPVDPQRFFLDTNIVVYTFEKESSPERVRARELVEMALTTRPGVISHQVVQEFLSVATRKFAVPLSAADCRLYLERVLVPLWHSFPSRDLYQRALEVQEDSGYGFYDSLIVAAAVMAGCGTLYPQDLQHGRTFGAMVVVDPFRA